MAKSNLNFEAVEKAERVPRWKSREPDPTVQMSIRMHASVYERFRELCKRERRTNGEMLEIMMDGYASTKR
jgi:uncharacterized protein (DUF4415 family)